MRVKTADELVAVVAHHFVAGEIHHRPPRFGKQDRRIENQECHAHHDEEL
jgi:hypothetical protein